MHKRCEANYDLINIHSLCSRSRLRRLRPPRCLSSAAEPIYFDWIERETSQRKMCFCSAQHDRKQTFSDFHSISATPFRTRAEGSAESERYEEEEGRERWLTAIDHGNEIKCCDRIHVILSYLLLFKEFVSLYIFRLFSRADVLLAVTFFPRNYDRDAGNITNEIVSFEQALWWELRTISFLEFCLVYSTWANKLYICRVKRSLLRPALESKPQDFHPHILSIK